MMPSFVPLALFLVACSVPPPGHPDTAHALPDDTGAATTTGEITGTVFDPEGDPLRAAHITTIPAGRETVSDDDGAYQIDRLSPGSYVLVAAAEGYTATESDRITVSADQASVLDLTVADALTAHILVTIEGPDGVRMENATVTAGDVVATTNVDGVAELDVPPGTFDVVVTTEDAAHLLWPYTFSQVQLRAGGGAQLAATLSGRPPEEDNEYLLSSWCIFCHGEAHADDSKHPNALTQGAAPDLDAWFAAGTTVDLGEGATATLSLSGDDQLVTLEMDGEEPATYTVQGWIGDLSSRSIPYTNIAIDWTEETWPDTANAFPLPVAWVAATDDADARWDAYQPDAWVEHAGLRQPTTFESAQLHCFGCHVTSYTFTPRDDGGVYIKGSIYRWQEDGVQCGACHGLGQAHYDAATEDKPYTITNPGLLDPQHADQVCGACHGSWEGEWGVAVPWTEEHGRFQPGETLEDYATSQPELWDNGSAAIHHEQYDEHLASAHSAGLRCIDCHASHGDSGEPAGLRDTVDDNHLCLSCHETLSFDDDPDQVPPHTGHLVYDPDGVTASGRCVSCHMPGTASAAVPDPSSGAGDAPSHLFRAWPPQDTVDAFDAADADELPLGTFPMHGCADCHARYNALVGEGSITGGDPTLRATHEDFQAAYDERF